MEASDFKSNAISHVKKLWRVSIGCVCESGEVIKSLMTGCCGKVAGCWVPMAGPYTTCVRVVTLSVSEVLLCECDFYELDRNIIFKDFFCFFCLFVCLFVFVRVRGE